MLNEKPSIASLLDSAEQSLQAHDISKALLAFNQVRENQAQNLRAVKGLACCYALLGEFDRAVEFWAQAAGADPFDVDTQAQLRLYRSPAFQSWLQRMSEAVKMIEIKDYQHARDQFKELLEERDGTVSLYQILGLSHMACCDPDSARRVWNRGLEFDSSNPMLLKYLIALDEIEKRKASNHEQKDSLIKQTWCTSTVGAVILGASLGIFLLVQIGLATSPGPAQKIILQEESLFGKQNSLTFGPMNKQSSNVNDHWRPAGTTGWADQANDATVDSEPATVKTEEKSYGEGFRAYLRGELDLARINFEAVVDQSSGSYINREALYYLARIEYLELDYDLAAPHFQVYLEQFPDSDYCDESLYYLGCIYHRQGRDQDARSVFKKLETMAPESGYLKTPDYWEAQSTGRT
ncbi:MAG TPA: tetratricopeptide repeat protein [Syntrophomonadaceae bacterium]|nr:tetratricopeptide repeat protein [Syntrophomonadaceae bacterium]